MYVFASAQSLNISSTCFRLLSMKSVTIVPMNLNISGDKCSCIPVHESYGMQGRLSPLPVTSVSAKLLCDFHYKAKTAGIAHLSIMPKRHTLHASAWCRYGPKILKHKIYIIASALNPIIQCIRFSFLSMKSVTIVPMNLRTRSDFGTCKPSK